MSHVDEVLFEALRCRKPQDLYTMLENKSHRDELLYADEKKKESAEREQREEKESGTTIVAH